MVLMEHAQLADTSTSRAERRVPGEVGAWVFIFGDMLVFALLFCAYLSARREDPQLFRAGQGELAQSYGAINTLLLLVSSLCVVTAVRALRKRVAGLAPRLFVLGFCCGLGFTFVKVLEYSTKIAQGFVPASNTFWMYFYVLTGLHLFHLIIGMGILAFCFIKSRRPERMSRPVFTFMEGGACFWHMVDLLWIVLFPLLYLA